MVLRIMEENNENLFINSQCTKAIQQYILSLIARKYNDKIQLLSLKPIQK